MPTMSSADAAKDASKGLVDAIANPLLAAPFACFVDQTMDDIQKLAYIFQWPSHPH